MPYIKQEKREIIDKYLDDLFKNIKTFTIGDINYTISQIVNRYIKENIINYTLLNSLIGVLECAKIELYQRVVTPYENEKIQQNGALY